MKIFGLATLASLVMAVVSHGIFNASLLATVASYVVSGQVVLGAALVAAIVLNAKT